MHSKSKSYDTILEANKSSINKFGKVLKQPKEKQQFAEMNNTGKEKHCAKTRTQTFNCLKRNQK